MIPGYPGPMTITVSVPDQLARQAAGQGLSVEAYVEQLAEQAAQNGMTASTEGGRRAVDGLLAFRRTHRLTLNRDRSAGLRSWLHQDHKR